MGLDPAVAVAAREAHDGPGRVDPTTDDGDAAIRATELPQSRGALSGTAMYWLARAFLLRHLLPGREGPPARSGGESAADPSRERSVPARLTPGLLATAPAVARPPSGTADTPNPAASRSMAVQPSHADGQRMSPSVSGWGISRDLAGRAADALRGAGVLAERLRVALIPADAVAVPRYVEVAAVAALTLVAVFLRAWDLPGSPAGIHGDETEMALEALRSIESGGLGIWTGVTLGQPAGYAHWMSLIFRIGGAEVTAMRLASAIPGIAIVPVGYLLVRSLFPFRVALISAALLVFSLWFVIQSRIAFGGITAVFMAILAMWLLIETVRGRRWWIAVAAGVALGLGLYTFKSFLLYFAGIWGLGLLATGMRPELRRNRELWLALAVSLIVGGPMLLFYAASGFIGPNLTDLYQVSLTSPSTWLRVPGLAVDAVWLVHLPVEGNTIDAAPAIPVLPLAAAIAFWAGLAATLLSCRDGRSRLLLAGWLIGMAPVLFVPGAESRRYLLGIFFVLVFVAIGADAVLNILGVWLRQRLRWPGLPTRTAQRAAAIAVVLVAVAFVALFSFQNLRELDRWSGGGTIRWFFNYEYHEALTFLRESGTERDILLYSARQSFDSSIRKFLLPGATGSNVSVEHGGDGRIPAQGEIARDTVIVLMDDYLAMADSLESEFPDAVKLGEGVADGRQLFAVFLVPGTGTD